MKNKLLSLLVIAAVLLSLVSCGKEAITFDEIKEVLPTLVENSYILNEIYFGSGFYPLPDASLNDVSGYYYADCTKCSLYSVADIKAATEKVFTKEYSEILYEGAFESKIGDSGTVLPKYIDGNLGLMQSMSADIYHLEKREYFYDTLNIVRTEDDRVTVSLECAECGKKSRFELILVRIENMDGTYSYRLDSPTY
ncbi:MAG: hypothetical protein IIX18_04450 [Clostridia bacterium]|nr:hypothetical protein [Clostridia bacterium]